ncbi:hypothetical protein RND81_01G012100 [Saponaria officinalis]|uniref:Exostosin GT47 domain-containing protein n=1 Tax=Saponaria officinalis TaxID=3572 RepID=A0AAW1N829_SAPOF
MEYKGLFGFAVNNIIQSSAEHVNCTGKYIYVLDLPSKFNTDLLENCSSINPWKDICALLGNSGLGEKIRVTSKDDIKVFSGSNWYDTDQFSSEVIFHSRMKQYKCLTNDYSEASAVFVPFYSGLDVGRYLWTTNATLRDGTAKELVEFLTQRPEWKRFGGRDHFLIAGRITWDFSRTSENLSTPDGWGNHLLDLPEMKNVTSLLLEASPTSKSEIGIPYPTYFHPETLTEVDSWQNQIRRKNRPYLFSFAGAPRPNIKESIRNLLIDQCLAAAKHGVCNFLHMNPDVKPVTIMSVFQQSDFCLQPPGDSYTRKSTFDSILAGCIPVFFHPGSAYVHYIWHLPKNYSSYSVFIPMNDLMSGNVSIEKTLSRIPKYRVKAMREEVIKLIPRIVYANPNSNVVDDSFEDAFEVAVQGVLNRVERLKSEINGSNYESVIPNELAWKYKFFGDLDNHDWDKYFGY